jgi:hypothetical protein
MSAALASSVHRARYEYEARTSKRPTKLLLGKRELVWLQRIAASSNAIVVTAPGPSRTEYMGLAVYAVDDEEYLEVAP